MTYEALGKTYIHCCATCAHWDKDSEVTFAGRCLISGKTAAEYPGASTRYIPTLDLSICSKWQQADQDTDA